MNMHNLAAKKKYFSLLIEHSNNVETDLIQFLGVMAVSLKPEIFVFHL